MLFIQCVQLKAQDNSDWDTAIECFSNAVELNGSNSNYLYHLAYCLQEMAPEVGKREGEYHLRALGHYLEVLKINPKHHEAWYNLGYVQEELERFEDAVASFNKALAIDPNDKDALINLGNCYMSLNDFDSSVKMYHAAIELEPNCVMSHYNLASAHHSAATSASDPEVSRKHYQEARGEFQAAIRLNSDYADAYYNLGICYQDEGDDENARRMYRAALDLQPSECPVARLPPAAPFSDSIRPLPSCKRHARSRGGD